MKKYVSLLSVALLFVFTPAVHAAVSPLAVSLFPPAQFPPSDFNVTGLRLGILGSHRNMYGIDIGAIGNMTEQKFTGIAVAGIFNATNGMTTAIGTQLAGIANVNNNKTNVYGLQLALVSNYNKAESSVVGLQFALVNLSSFTNIYGFQVGLYNTARVVRGFQIGLINVTDSLHGIQIGLLNFHHQGTFVVSPIINIGF